MKKNPWNRCDICGKFIPIKDFNSGDASRKLITPDSDYSSETFETMCKACRAMVVYMQQRYD